MRKRKVTYPVARTSQRPPRDGAEPPRPNLVAIDLNARTGRPGIKVGDRVRIAGTGLYSGETATVESEPGGVIPAASVRTDSGQVRRVRTVDLVPLAEDGPKA